MNSIVGEVVWVIDAPGGGPLSLRRGLVLSTREREGPGRPYEGGVTVATVQGNECLRVSEVSYIGACFAGYLTRLWAYSLEQLHPELRAKLEAAGEWPEPNAEDRWHQWTAAEAVADRLEEP